MIKHTRSQLNYMEYGFEFTTDSQSVVFCEKIADQMVALFRVSLDEAIGRINRDWQGLEIVGPHDVIYHEDEEYWAKTIYFGNGSNWWLNPPGLKPRSYPDSLLSGLDTE